MAFAYSARTSVLALALAACTPGPMGGDTDTTTTSGATSEPAPGTEGMSSTDTPTGTTAVPGTTATDGTTGTTGEPITTTLDPGTTDEPNTTTLGPGTTTDTTTGVFVCDLVQITTEQAHELGGVVEDCGVVDPWNNSAAEWQAARDCALAAAGAQQQFQLVTWRQGIDSSIGRGYTGVAARSFALAEIHFDSLGSPIAFSQPCAGLVAVDGCTVAPGEACLACAEPGVAVTVCDVP
ncbi:hypothetical protein SAMN02745121_03291 [Nannocystis exedens]|uniref:Uncharacterized protein n=1 Tax=Nannocystis exedens TaxID=54 RepID=A0A1I1YBP2_9BACT|nr:hypothetical protein [Nannocystis exedens]PCC71941.1 hypothetical protein NAEX_05020 [Nannocystis exedens]SFE16839.1 hypothetical protein SAMN02745121_03291 [Nannocystis exedens]